MNNCISPQQGQHQTAPPFLFRLCVAAVLCFLPSLVNATEPFVFDSKTQGSHVMSMAVDRAGSVWVGMQDWAVWNRMVDAKGNAHWRQFTVKDGLGDNDAYAMASDKQGRVWVGHLNHGVSVWNGETWKNYGALEGPLGERVFDIAVCPTDGDVWIATDAGLTRYSDKKDSWTYYSRADGMSSDQVAAIAFDHKGNIYCGTQADGVALAHAAKNYSDWTNVRANTVMPSQAEGKGLPSNLVNDILVAHGTSDGVGADIIYAATVNGLAWSRDGGVAWQFVRGADWQANITGRTGKAVPVAARVDEDELLLQDWTTCLAEDRAGLLWVGHLRKGFEARDPRTMRATYVSSEAPLVEGDEDFVRAMIDAPGAGFLIGRYGDSISPGVSSLGKQILSRDDAPSSATLPTASVPTSALPSPAKPPTIAQLNVMRSRVSKLETPLKPGDAAFLGDDWVTQGDWVGRYGRGHATLAAMDGGANEEFTRLGRSPDHVLNGVPGYSVSAQNGPRRQTSLVPWVTWANTSIPRALYDPLIGHRRHAEWNDLSNFIDMYPWAFDGPDIWITVKVPAGMHRASLYSYNKDGQRTRDRYRDFPVELKHAPTTPPPIDPVVLRLKKQSAVLQNQLLAARKKFTPRSPQVVQLSRQVNSIRNQLRLRDPLSGDNVLIRTDATAPLARTRICDFWGGVYKQFALCGPATYYFKVGRNHSYGVLVSAVLLDAMDNPSAPIQPPKALSWMNGVVYSAPAIEDTPVDSMSPHNTETITAARALWTGLDAAAWKQGGSAMQRSMRLQALRAAIAADAPASLVANWRWKLGLWNEAERTQWSETMQRAFPIQK